MHWKPVKCSDAVPPLQILRHIGTYSHTKRCSLQIERPTSFHLPISANSAHRQRGDDADHGRDQDDDERQPHARLRHHPRDAQEQHHAPDVQQARDQHALVEKS